MSKFGAVDILVNSQGANLKRPAAEISTDDWEFTFDVNIKGAMLAWREFGKVIIDKRVEKTSILHR